MSIFHVRHLSQTTQKMSIELLIGQVHFTPYKFDQSLVNPQTKIWFILPPMLIKLVHLSHFLSKSGQDNFSDLIHTHMHFYDHASDLYQSPAKILL
jgi:hypothetical protein